MTPILTGILVYVVLQMAVGLWASRRVAAEDDYLLAGRRLSGPVAAFSVFATWFGAETCIGSSARAYESGLAGGSADPFGYTLCLLVMGVVFLGPLYRMRLTTVGDLFRRRYSPAVERVAVLIMVPTSVLWAAAQIRAFGHVLSASSDLEIHLAIALATGVVILYTVSGGLLADAVTDVVQGGALIVGLVVIAWSVNADLDGSWLSNIEPGKWSLADNGGSPWATAEGWAIPILGSVMAQELISRILASHSQKAARQATLSASGIYLVVGLIPFALGMLGPSLLPGLEDPEEFLPTLAQQHLGTVLYILFAGALVSAILSTVDSALLAASSLVSHNLVIPMIPGIEERRKVRIARLGVLAFGLIAFALAISAESVFSLVEDASAFGTSGIFVVAASGLLTKRGGPAAAMASLLTGIGVWVSLNYILEWEVSYLPSLGVAALAYWGVVLLLERTKSEVRGSSAG